MTGAGKDKRCRRVLMAGVAILATLPFCACGRNRNLAAQTARHLHSDIVAYEVLLNDRIAHEKAMYDERLAMIRGEEADLLTHNLDQVRRHRSAELASAMSADPDHDVRIGNVIHFLNETVQAEYGLYWRLRDKETSASAEFQAALTTLNQHREKLARIEEQCAGLATRSKLRNNNKLLMASVDELLDQLESDQQNQAEAKRKGRMPHPFRRAQRAADLAATSAHR